jgi:hypothetical protein
MESDELDSHQVVTGSNTGWHLKVLPTTAIDHTVDTPLTATVIKTVLSDLEPTQAPSVGISCVVDLREVDHCGT